MSRKTKVEHYMYHANEKLGTEREKNTASLTFQLKFDY